LDNSLNNLSIQSIGAVSAVSFSGATSLNSSTVRNCIIQSNSAAAPSVDIRSTGVVTGSISNLDTCQIENRGGEAVNQGNGTSRFRDVYTSDVTRTGVNIDRGICLIEDSRFVAVPGVGLTIGVNGEARVDPATRWSSLTNNGTLTYYETGISPQYIPAVPGDWAGTAPINLQEATDRMAALLFANFGAIP
jgi:hypothetical protein